MEFISKLIVEYQEQCNTYDSEKDKIEKKIARLQKKYDKLQRPHWTKHFVRPIINEVASRTPDITWEIGETLHTLGLRCEYLVFGTTKDGHTVGITFTPGINAPHYDTGKYHSKSPFQTLQDLNGLNNITKPIESIDELIGMVRKDEQEAILYAQKAQIPEQE